METLITRLVEAREAGRLSRREFVAGLAALMSAAGSGTAAAGAPDAPFQAVGTNHVAVRVTNIPRSRAFYSQLLGIPATRESESACFLTMRSGFLTLFRNDTPGLDHFCLAVEKFDVDQAAEILQRQGLKPDREGDRIYFNDPDGLRVQLSSWEHTA